MSDMNEEWKTFFENYEISNFGNMRKKNKDEYEYNIHLGIGNHGYKYKSFKRHKKTIKFLVHQMVAYQFLGERPTGFVIDHIDRNKLNNHVSNLRYCSYKDNNINSSRYRDDITETDPRLRKNIMGREYDIKIGKISFIRRQRGSGSLYERNGRYFADIQIKKIRYCKSFPTREEAEEFIKQMKELHL